MRMSSIWAHVTMLLQTPSSLCTPPTLLVSTKLPYSCIPVHWFQSASSNSTNLPVIPKLLLCNTFRRPNVKWLEYRSITQMKHRTSSSSNLLYFTCWNINQHNAVFSSLPGSQSFVIRLLQHSTQISKVSTSKIYQWLPDVWCERSLIFWSYFSLSLL